MDHIPNKLHQMMTKRSAMPQIADLDKFKSFLRSREIDHGMTNIHPRHLAASQGNFIMKKVDELRKLDSHSPIIIANDLHVLDGHHRWLAQSDKEELEALRVELPIDKLMDIAYEFESRDAQEK